MRIKIISFITTACRQRHQWQVSRYDQRDIISIMTDHTATRREYWRGTTVQARVSDRVQEI